MGKAIFLVVFAIAYTIQTITGFAGNVIAMPAGMSTIGLHETVAVLNVAGTAGCGALALVNIKYVNWRELGRILVVMTPFVFVGVWLDTILPTDVLARIYGAIVLIVAIRFLVSKKQKFLRRPALFIILVLAGLVQGMFVSGGAVLAIYAVQKLRDKDEFRATLSALWTVLNAVYMVISIKNGYFTPDAIQLSIAIIPIIAITMFIGGKLQKHLSQQLFLRLVYVLLVIIGIILLVG